MLNYHLKIKSNKGGVFKMNFVTFIKYFTFVFLLSIVLILVSVILCVINRSKFSTANIALLITFGIFASIIFGLLGAITASEKIISFKVKNKLQAIQLISTSLDKAGYKKEFQEDNQLIFNTKPYTEWFYGKVYIKTSDETIEIKSSKWIIKKYLSNLELET